MSILNDLAHLEDQYVLKLQEAQTIDDIENAHVTADSLLCEMLIELGFNDVVKEYKKIFKYYA